jgi:hypothetical protein
MKLVQNKESRLKTVFQMCSFFIHLLYRREVKIKLPISLSWEIFLDKI